MFRTYVLTIGVLVFLVPFSVGAAEGHRSHGAEKGVVVAGMGEMGGMGMGKPSEDKTKQAQEMQAQMNALEHHSKMMENMTDPAALNEEMKKHMRMMDEMMKKMMESMKQDDKMMHGNM